MPIQRSGPVEGTSAEAAVLTTVLTAGAIARSDIARRTGLSSAAITRATAPLLDAGILRYADDGEVSAAPSEAASHMGRPRSPLTVRVNHTGVLGIKLTAHEAIGVVCDLAGAVRARDTQMLGDISIESVLQSIDMLVTRLRKTSDRLQFIQPVQHIGLSLSGDIDSTTGRVRYSPFLGWRDVALGPLTAALTGCAVVVENDVKALAVAEQWFGLARGLRNFALVTIGTGIGCALVVDGALVRGSHSVAGEIGHLPVGDPTVACPCGGRGCVEAEASTAALARRCCEVANDSTLTLAAAIERARSGDGALADVFSRAGWLIGLAIASMTNLLGPSDVIVSGEGVASYDLLEVAIRQSFSQQAFGAAVRTNLHLHPLSFDEWAHGAAAVALEEFAFPARDSEGRRLFAYPDAPSPRQFRVSP